MKLFLIAIGAVAALLIAGRMTMTTSKPVELCTAGKELRDSTGNRISENEARRVACDPNDREGLRRAMEQRRSGN